MNAGRCRVCVFGERLAPPADEGIKKLTLSIASAYRSLGHDVLLLTTGAPDWPEQDARSVEADRLLRSPGLASALARFRPDVIIYVPTASLTLASGLRSRSLRRYAGAPVALVATQGRHHNALVRLAAPFVAPDLCLTFAAHTRAQARALGWPAAQVPPGVDLQAFRPVSSRAKAALRARFGLPADAFVVLHVGHLNRRRGVPELALIAGSALPVLAASTSTARDEGLAEELRRVGAIVLDDYIPDIASLYAASDAYLFPVPPNPLAPSSIDVPLSVLEAAACGLPVVARRFGALPELWPDAQGVFFYDGPEQLRETVESIRAMSPRAWNTRALVAPFDWRGVAAGMLDALGRERGPAALEKQP
jgi:glycosyltransferase involved in cell wall biosynthesis